MYVPNMQRTTAGLGLAAILLSSVYVSVNAPPAPAQQQPGDLPGTATTAALILGTAQARLATCQAQNEAAYNAAWECAGRVAAAQTALAPVPTVTTAP